MLPVGSVGRMGVEGTRVGTACRFSGVGGSGMGRGGFSSSVQQCKATSQPPGKASIKMIVWVWGGCFVCVWGLLCVCVWLLVYVCVCVWGGYLCLW